jgi:hypothetical protein
MLDKGALVVWLEDNVVNKETLTRNLYAGNSMEVAVHLIQNLCYGMQKFG